MPGTRQGTCRHRDPDTAGQPNEEFYKWQFISHRPRRTLPEGLRRRRGSLPKGQQGFRRAEARCGDLRRPGVVHHYNEYWSTKNPLTLDRFNEHLWRWLSSKKGDKGNRKVFTGQVKAAMREKRARRRLRFGHFITTPNACTSSSERMAPPFGTTSQRTKRARRAKSATCHFTCRTRTPTCRVDELQTPNQSASTARSLNEMHRRS